MVFKRKIIPVIITISLLASPFAYKAYATDLFASIKFSLDIVAKAAAQGAFTTLTNRIFNKIQTGGLSGALFVQDWREFQLGSQHRGEDVFRAILHNTPLCDYIQDDVRGIFGGTINISTPQNIRVDNLDPFTLRGRCTMPAGFDINAYQQDFEGSGGWFAFQRMLQPQNNAFGAIAISYDELQRQRALEERSALNEVTSGGGFMGIRECLVQQSGPTCDGNACSNGAGPCREDSDCGSSEPLSACAILGRIKTPGSTLGEQVASVFDKNLQFYTTADSASLAIAVFTEFIVDKLLDQGLDPGSTVIDTETVGPGREEGELHKSYFSEYCSARDNMSTIPSAQYVYDNEREAYDMFPPEEDINSREAHDDNDVGKSYCKERFDCDDNKAPFTRCMKGCYQALGLAPGNNLIGPDNVDPSTGRWTDSGATSCNDVGGGDNDPPTDPCGGSGTCNGNCSIGESFRAELEAAIDDVIERNPGGIADALNTTANSFTFVDEVAESIMANTGLIASSNIFNGNDGANQGDLIAIWASSATTAERYDIVAGAGVGDTPLSIAGGIVDFTGVIPISCTE